MNLKLPETLSASGNSSLDDILNVDVAIGGQADKDCRRIIEYITQKCLRRSPGYRSSTGDGS